MGRPDTAVKVRCGLQTQTDMFDVAGVEIASASSLSSGQSIAEVAGIIASV